MASGSARPQSRWWQTARATTTTGAGQGCWWLWPAGESWCSAVERSRRGHRTPPPQHACPALPPPRSLIQPTATFSWRSSDLGGSDVLLTGSFNSWAELLPLAADPATGQHTLWCCLPQGHYQFQFFVDGQWLLCPSQPTTLTEQGRLVNRRVGTAGRGAALEPGEAQHSSRACRRRGPPRLPLTAAACPTPHCRSMEVRAPPAYHIYYATGWTSAVLHVRHAAGPGEAEEPWQALPMHSTSSRSRPKGGTWLTATVCALPLEGAAAEAAAAADAELDAAAAVTASQGGSVAGLSWDGEAAEQGARHRSFRPLEFFITSADGAAEDRPYGGGAYRCHHPGGFKLRGGALRPFPMATKPPVMLVGGVGWGGRWGRGTGRPAASALS